MDVDLFLADADATGQLGAALARHLPDRAVVHLHGDLGAGKSTLARALLRALGVAGTIRSPTYTLVEPYSLPEGGLALHLDLYRIGDAAELEFLGLGPTEARLWLVEWPERGADALPAPDLSLHLALAADGRRCTLRTRTPVGEAWLAACQADRPAPMFSQP